MYMYVQLLRQGKVRQLCLRTTLLFFRREKEELPQAGLKPAMFCVLDVHVHVPLYIHIHVYITADRYLYRHKVGSLRVRSAQGRAQLYQIHTSLSVK